MELILNEHALHSRQSPVERLEKTGADLGLHFPLPLL